jgi:hypothetical protein
MSGLSEQEFFEFLNFSNFSFQFDALTHKPVQVAQNQLYYLRRA